MAIRNVAAVGGRIDYTTNGAGFRIGTLTEDVTGATDASKALSTQLPANTRLLSAGFMFTSAITLVTATNIGFGVATAPTLLGCSGTTMTVNTKTNPIPLDGDGLMFSSNAASAAYTNSTVATNFDKTYTIPANYLKPGDIIRIKYQGIATSTNATDTLAVRALIGSYVADTQGAVDVANNDTFMGLVEIEVRAIGASGTAVGVVVAPVIGAGKTDGTSTVTFRSGFKGSGAMDTTADQVVAIEGTWSVASASNSCRLDFMSVEVVRAKLPYSGTATTLTVYPVSTAGVAAGTFAGTVRCVATFVEYPAFASV